MIVFQSPYLTGIAQDRFFFPKHLLDLLFAKRFFIQPHCPENDSVPASDHRLLIDIFIADTHPGPFQTLHKQPVRCSRDALPGKCQNHQHDQASHLFHDAPSSSLVSYGITHSHPYFLQAVTPTSIDQTSDWQFFPRTADRCPAQNSPAHITVLYA